MNRLKIIATPIGNLDDVTTNMINTINELDYIFCEDTRVTNKFLKLIGITKSIKLISYHKFNENEKLLNVIETIKNNKCGLMSDAGYPSLSDPGYLLVTTCHNEQILVDVIDGPCAINHAIVQSGMCSTGFCFIGFLTKKESSTLKLLNSLFKNNLPIVCFESVHRINETLLMLKQNYPNLQIYVGRELSKKFETYYVGEIANTPIQVEKGEFTLVLYKPQQKNSSSITDDMIDEELKLLIAANIKLKDACKYLANKFDLSSTEIYNSYQSRTK